jgi:hypothetical protein
MAMGLFARDGGVSIDLVADPQKPEITNESTICTRTGLCWISRPLNLLQDPYCLRRVPRDLA